jgi:hypothetical protein
MKTACAFTVMVCWLAQGGLRADDIALPMPRGVPRVWKGDSYPQFSASDFEQRLQQLKEERAALATEWKALIKQSPAETPRKDNVTDLQTQMQEVLRRLQQSRLPNGPSLVPASPDLAIGKVAEPMSTGDKKDHDVPLPSKEEAEGGTGAVDPLAQAHTLFRARQYGEALASFRLVDLKGKKADARAPIQYLTALCLLHLGKAEEAVPLLRDVANSRGDEVLASYAQWQLDMLRWQTNVQGRLEEFRNRRLAVEKKL